MLYDLVTGYQRFGVTCCHCLYLPTLKMGAAGLSVSSVMLKYVNKRNVIISRVLLFVKSFVGVGAAIIHQMCAVYRLLSLQFLHLFSFLI